MYSHILCIACNVGRPLELSAVVKCQTLFESTGASAEVSDVFVVSLGVKSTCHGSVPQKIIWSLADRLSFKGVLSSSYPINGKANKGLRVKKRLSREIVFKQRWSNMFQFTDLRCKPRERGNGRGLKGSFIKSVKLPQTIRSAVGHN